MKLLRRFFMIFLICTFAAYSQGGMNESIIKNENGIYLTNTLVIKLKPPQSLNKSSADLSQQISKLFGQFKIISAEPMFKNISSDNSPLAGIIQIKYESGMDPIYIASKMKGSAEIEWAEPKFVYEVDYVPNDPSLGNQYNLPKINAAQAWDISKGDTSIIIAIIDTGVDWDHPDLAANIWRNWGEIPDNGIDDDLNGYIDDVRGWDFAGIDGNSPNNNPMEDVPTHGSFVAGVASAVTDNGIGIASIGFNSKIMPVKTSFGNSRLILYGYEGIVYAADNGAKIINCSWGGPGYSILGQEIINYALSKGALVVAAAGNENTSTPSYPASYTGVLNVASTDQGDVRSSFSNYGSSITVTAPGSGIYSTWQNDSYLFGSGTSYSSPLAAGLAALVAAQFPNYTPLQIAEQIRINSDDIYSQNPSFQDQLGKGRINAFKSVNENNSVSVRITDITFSDEAPGGNGDGIFQAGETISVYLNFTNYLDPTNNLNIYLENKNIYSTPVDAIFNAGARATLESFDNNSAKFTFTLANSLPQNVTLPFRVNFIDGDYLDFQLIETIGNPTYATHAGNNVALTITSKGTLAFNDFPSNSQGEGFTYLNGSNHLFEGALMIGTSQTNLSNAARGSGSTQDNDFSILQPFLVQIPGSTSDVQGSSIFNDDNAGGNKIAVTAALQSYTYADPPNDNYIILRYTFTNNSGADINNFYAGLFFDWDMVDGSGIDDYTAWDTSGSFGYVYHLGGNPDTWIAAALISHTNFGFWAINNAGGDGGFQIYDGFSDAEKWQSLSSEIGKPQAGGGDVSHVVSGGPYNIPADQSIDVAFTIAAGLNQDELNTAVGLAKSKYASILTSVENENSPLLKSYSLSQNYPNPFNPKTKIKFSIIEQHHTELKIYDVLGNEVAGLVGEVKSPGEYEIDFDGSSLTSGIYFYRLTSGAFYSTKKMILMK
jgi:serine protease